MLEQELHSTIRCANCSCAYVLYCCLQSEAGWSQHDFGHLSVFKDNRLNHVMHSFVMNCIKVRQDFLSAFFLI